MSDVTRAESLRRLEQEVAVMIRRVRRVVRERARLIDPELQPASYLMLGYIAEHQPLRASEMCAVFDLDKGAVSRQVQHLLDLGLVERTPDPDDGRATLISATADGASRMADVADHRRKLLDERLGGWSAEELAAFAAQLGRYNAALAGDTRPG